MTIRPVARERRPTLYFLREIRAVAPVHLDTEVDMTRIREHRTAAREAGRHYSWVSYVLHAASRALAAHPEANAAFGGRFRPRVARFPSVHGKFTMDHTVNGRRVVLSAVIPHLQVAGLDEIQRQVDHYTRGDAERMPEFAGARLIRRLPRPVGAAAYRSRIRPLRTRATAIGTFTVTSLSHSAVDGFHSTGGTTVTLGLGRVADRPVVRDGAVTAAPVMRLNLTFDHRVIDGAEAADLLTDIRTALEDFREDTAAGDTGTNDVGELKRFVLAHTRGQNVPHHEEVLARVRTDADGDGSWTAEWSRSARALERHGRLLDACRHHSMARFPFVDGPARRRALEETVRTFDQWRRADGDIERLEVDLPAGRVAAWATGLSDGVRRPVMLVSGGIVTVKEQWAPTLAAIRRLGMAGIVTEMPGVGENTLPYDEQSWTMLSRLLDHVADRADVANSHALALSFSGHLAMRCALEDGRIRSVLTAGAPVHDFFTDRDWQAALPRLTVDTLAHLVGEKPEDALDRLRGWALRPEQLRALDVPVRYVACERDEIIPGSDVALLREHVRDIEILTHDDVHGAPAHAAETQLWLIRSLLRLRGGKAPTAITIGLLYRLARLRAAAPG
ncbi:2-oxo acid dehydrogenase subunit E2 [Actinomadura kijaniata]|uniref:Hydrolase superfamily dihydrolipoamide acyltransferase-like protein n=1 Tax=Actinomadura kijaniata TaxID=46161 RepID=B3TMQ0_ACTKI|nr:2-oxo acid dehydrogenase subunit E2 [Actinomadura kijaniata]ACB46480.1 hydrolase superfamily dihydrolipoamide acyltransferase-like protein [Actinomadura kijaniata]